jgi:hypothetical protein
VVARRNPENRHEPHVALATSLEHSVKRANVPPKSPAGVPGITPIPLEDGGRVVWTVASDGVGVSPLDAARRLRRVLRDPRDVAGVILDLRGITAPTSADTQRLLDLAGELERRGVGVAAVGGSAELIMGLCLEHDLSCLPRVEDVSSAIAVLREFDHAARRWAASPRGPVRVVRFPARRESVAPLCRLVRLRLGEDGLARRPRDRIVSRAWGLVHTEILPACDPSRDSLGVSARVHGSRVTVTILDEGRGERPQHEEAPGGGMRIHRFRILGRHHATVLEATHST